MAAQAADGLKHVLVPVADGSEEIESVTIIDTLVRAGASVTVASVADDVEVRGSCVCVCVGRVVLLSVLCGGLRFCRLLLVEAVVCGTGVLDSNVQVCPVR